ncbi:MAG TPA: cell division protein FtsZ [Thermoanaerobaculia bacterium]|jgi:cell division protein FtsZ
MILFDDEPRASLPISLNDDVPPARIKVMGVGGGGGNAVNRMIQAGIKGIDFVAANTDLQVLRVNRAATKLQLGLTTSRGMGAGSNPDVGRNAALEDAERITQVLAGSDMVFVTAGMGGGTGTGAAPVVARLASEAGALVVAIVSKPFSFEGRRKLRYAEDGIAELREYVDTLITIPNERLYSFVDRNVTTWEAFRIADDVLRQAVQGISDLITVPGIVNLDFADVKTVMENMGMALMGTGTASGEHRAVEAAQRAISNPLLEEQSIQGARAILINVTGGEDLTLAEVNEACAIIQAAADEEANVIFGLVQDKDMKDEVKISVIATGFDAPAALASRREVSLPVTPSGARSAADRGDRERERERARTSPDVPAPEDHGYGVNLINVRDPREDIFDIPTFLRRQMD